MRSWLEDARKKSGLSPEDCASALRCSRATYCSRENAPGNLSIDEIRLLRNEFNKEGRKVLWTALCEFKP